jgi:hypothetical protein
MPLIVRHALQPGHDMRVCFGKEGNDTAAGFGSLAPLHMPALNGHLLGHLAILIDLADRQRQELTHPQACLQRDFETAPIALRILAPEALPHHRHFLVRIIPHAGHQVLLRGLS